MLKSCDMWKRRIKQWYDNIEAEMELELDDNMEFDDFSKGYKAS